MLIGKATKWGYLQVGFWMLSRLPKYAEKHWFSATSKKGLIKSQSRLHMCSCLMLPWNSDSLRRHSQMAARHKRTKQLVTLAWSLYMDRNWGGELKPEAEALESEPFWCSMTLPWDQAPPHLFRLDLDPCSSSIRHAYIREQKWDTIFGQAFLSIAVWAELGSKAAVTGIIPKESAWLVGLGLSQTGGLISTSSRATYSEMAAPRRGTTQCSSSGPIQPK